MKNDPHNSEADTDFEIEFRPVPEPVVIDTGAPSPSDDDDAVLKEWRKSEVDLEAIRTKLSSETGKKYWRTLDELADSESFQEMLKSEFPRYAEEGNGLQRREFLKLSGASLALAGLAACTKQPEELIVPYVYMPEGIIPGNKPSILCHDHVASGLRNWAFG